MLKTRFSIFIILLTFAAELHAHEPKKGTVMGTWGPYFYTTDLNGSFDTADEYVLGGFSIVAEGDVDKNGGLEIAMTYMPQIYYRAQRGLILVEKVKRMHISIGYRHWFNSKYSFAGGLYSSYSMGDVETLHSNVPSGEVFNTTAQDVSEDGIDFSFVHEFYQGEKTYGIVDLRYSYSLSSKEGEIRDVYGLMIGVKHFIQENTRSETTP